MTALRRKLLRDLWHIKTQGLAIAVVIACGVGTVIMSVGMMESLDETRSAYYERYRFADVFAPVRRAPEYLARRIAEIPGVQRVQTRIIKGMTLDMPGLDEPASGMLISIPEKHDPVLNSLVLRKGQSVRAGYPDDVIVSEPFAEAHSLNPGDSISAIINGHRRVLWVAGVAISPEFVYALGPGQLMPDNRTYGIFWVGRSGVEAAFDLMGAFNNVTLSLSRTASEPDVIDALDDLLDPYGGTGAYGRDEQFSNEFLSAELDQLRNWSQIMPPIFLGVAAFLLHIVISRLVATEREQIGLLKAFGYTSLAVGWHYLEMVLVLAGVGLVGGFALGIWIGRLMAELYMVFFSFPFLFYETSLAVFALASFVTLATVAVGALSSVRTAVRLAPAVAMVPSPPVRYKHSLMERLGLAEEAAGATRMILRHISRWPMRSALTSLGVAASGALLVGSLFAYDAMEQMIDVYYFMSQRQDITLTYAEARPGKIVHEVNRLPGVMHAENYRAVPARLRHEHHSERVPIVGVASDSTLSQLIDPDLRPIAVPREGITLTTRVAESLGTKAGEIIRIEILEGRRPIIDMPVSAVVEEYIGMTAYMYEPALHRMLREPDIASGTHIMVEKGSEAELYRQVKDMPAVAGVMLKARGVQAFRDTLAESILMIILIYVLFGGAIAFGVVYNTARISLSERSRELASMRVLGFTKGEVAYILLGELALLVLIALPFACILGYLLASTITAASNTDVFRIPLTIARSTYGTAIATLVGASILSGIIVGLRINRLDMIGVLKTRD